MDYRDNTFVSVLFSFSLRYKCLLCGSCRIDFVPVCSQFSVLSVTVLGPVRNIATDDVSPDTLTISWGLQNESPCPTDTHIVEYSLSNRDQCDPIVDPVVIEYGNVTGTEVSITRLHPHSTYGVFVYSSNDKGRGNVSSITNVTSESGE